MHLVDGLDHAEHGERDDDEVEDDGDQVAVVDGKIVGTVLAGHDGRRGFIHHMAVLPEFRRKKIGHALAQTAIQKIREQGIDKTHIFCYQNNETGQSFWRDFGFEKREDVFVYSFSNDKI